MHMRISTVLSDWRRAGNRNIYRPPLFFAPAVCVLFSLEVCQALIAINSNRAALDLHLLWTCLDCKVLHA